MGQTCPQGKVLENGLCYTPCPSGYDSVGPYCWGECPAGYPDSGVTFCEKTYGRGGGHGSKEACEQSSDHGARENGCERWAALWYPRCDPSFHNVLCCVCSRPCPAGFTDTGATCEKPRFDRGVGTIPKLGSGINWTVILGIIVVLIVIIIMYVIHKI